MIPAEIIEQVAAATDLVEVVASQVELRKTGATYTGLCPFHQEKRPSFSVSPVRQRFRCFGCGAQGDVFGFVARVRNTNFPDAVRYLAERAGIVLRDEVGHGSRKRKKGMKIAAKPKKPTPSEPSRCIPWPHDLHIGSQKELQLIAALRGLSLVGVQLASQRGLLVFGRVCGFPCWIVTDETRSVAQARRMDGHLFPPFKDVLPERKTHTLKDGRASWPIGSLDASGAPFVVLCEGGPDLLSACHFILAEGREREVAAVAILGASNNIPEDALPFLAKRRVRLFPHVDPSGLAAASRWTQQLERTGATVDAFDFEGLKQTDGSPIVDLNDFARIAVDSFEAEREHLEEILPR